VIGVIGPDQLRQALGWAQAVEAVRAALMRLGAGQVIQPPVVELRMPDGGEMHVKGGHIAGSGWIVVKVATGGFPDGIPTGCLLLLDASSGEPRWLLDDRGWLTEQRTAAAGALAALTFARPDARSALILGTGGLTRALVDAHHAVTPYLDLTVWGRDLGRAQALAEELGIAVADDLEMAVRATDILVTATSSRAALIEADWIQPGTHVTAIGADTEGKHELPAGLLDRADLLVCDDVATAGAAGELQHASTATKARAVAWPALAVAGPVSRTASAVTVVDLCGIGAEDAAIATAALVSLGLDAATPR
jgi:ornithine cyclodeaminase